MFLMKHSSIVKLLLLTQNSKIYILIENSMFSYKYRRIFELKKIYLFYDDSNNNKKML